MNDKLRNFLIVFILIMLIASFPFILYLTHFKIIGLEAKFYEREFVKYGVYTQLPDIDLNKTNSELIYYLQYEKTNNPIDIPQFNEREKEHLIDVKNVVQNSLFFLGFIIALSLVFLVILWIIDKRDIRRNMGILLFSGGIFTFIDSILFFAWVRLNFESFFTLFHKIFFKAGSWLFYSNETIVMIYQEKIFYDVIIKIMITTLITAFIVMLCGRLLFTGKIEKKETKK